jgi:AraC-like DNA-binding protein
MFATILREIGRAIEAKMPPPPSAFQREAERRLEPLLADGNVRMEALARDLGCSRQTLYRRLKAEGLTFEALLNRLRRRLAIKFLTEEGVSVKEAAYRLGFADPAAFSRAFKRWTGSAPRSVRAAKSRPGGSGRPPPRAPARPTAG